MATVMVQSDKPGHPALLHKLSHALTYADRILVAHDVAHSIAPGVAHGIARDTAFGIALNVARSIMHGTLTAKHFPMM